MVGKNPAKTASSQSIAKGVKTAKIAKKSSKIKPLPQQQRGMSSYLVHQSGSDVIRDNTTVQCDDSSHDGWITDPENEPLFNSAITEKSQDGGLTWAEHVTQQEHNLAKLRQQTTKSIPATPSDFVTPEDPARPLSVRALGVHGRGLHGSSVHSSPPLQGGMFQSQSQSQSSYNILPDFEQPMVQHKAEVPPVFLAYR